MIEKNITLKLVLLSIMSIEVLEEVTELLKEFDYWVMGGYGLDIAVGKLTREHENVDVLIKLKDSGKIKLLLEENGFSVDYVKDKLVAKKNDRVINLLTMDEFRNRYVISTLNVEVQVPKQLMNNKIIGSLEDRRYCRVPNELLYLFMRYSLKPSDSVIVNNLPVNKHLLGLIKVNIKRR